MHNESDQHTSRRANCEPHRGHVQESFIMSEDQKAKRNAFKELFLRMKTSYPMCHCAVRLVNKGVQINYLLTAAVRTSFVTN